MSAARTIIAGLNDLRVFPHAVTRPTARGFFGPKGDGIFGLGDS